MSPARLQFSAWSERRQVLAIILVAGLVIFLLWFFLLAPLTLRRRRLEGEIEQLRSQLAQRNYLVGEEALLERKRAEQAAYNRLYGEWQEMSRRLATTAVVDGGETNAVGHIDYKVALFEARQRLLRKSRELRISIPRDLGVDDAVHSNEDARKLMFQLRALEKLVGTFLDLKISALGEIEPLPPRQLTVGKEKEPYLEEYPIRIEFFGKLENLYQLFHTMFREERVFVLRHVRVEGVSPEQPRLLRMKAEISALVFPREPKALSAPVEVKQVWTRPLGH